MPRLALTGAAAKLDQLIGLERSKTLLFSIGPDNPNIGRAPLLTEPKMGTRVIAGEIAEPGPDVATTPFGPVMIGTMYGPDVVALMRHSGPSTSWTRRPRPKKVRRVPSRPSRATVPRAPTNSWVGNPDRPTRRSETGPSTTWGSTRSVTIPPVYDVPSSGARRGWRT